MFVSGSWVCPHRCMGKKAYSLHHSTASVCPQLPWHEAAHNPHHSLGHPSHLVDLRPSG